MIHGGGESVAVVDPSSIVSQGHHASLAPGHGSWNFHQTDGGPVENGAYSSSIYYFDQQKESSVSADAQGGVSTAFHASTSGLNVANAAQAYAGYDPYGYSMYYGYQQPTSDSSSQHVGASQNPGALYQPPSSFQNIQALMSVLRVIQQLTINAGDHQITNNWNAASYGSYPHQHYPSYTTADTNSAQTTSAAVANPFYYPQPYNLWPYYSPSAPVVSGTPGTQNA